jgi:hypothetical protein
MDTSTAIKIAIVDIVNNMQYIQTLTKALKDVNKKETLDPNQPK